LQELPVSLVSFIFLGRDVSSTQLNGGSGLHNLQTAKVIHNSSDLFTVTFILLLAVYIFYGIASSTPVLQSRYNFNGVAMTVFGLSQPIVLVFVGKILYELLRFS
jgi:hypothetical protein